MYKHVYVFGKIKLILCSVLFCSVYHIQADIMVYNFEKNEK